MRILLEYNLRIEHRANQNNEPLCSRRDRRPSFHLSDVLLSSLQNRVLHRICVIGTKKAKQASSASGVMLRETLRIFHMSRISLPISEILSSSAEPSGPGPVARRWLGARTGQKTATRRGPHSSQ